MLKPLEASLAAADRYEELSLLVELMATANRRDDALSLDQIDAVLGLRPTPPASAGSGCLADRRIRRRHHTESQVSAP
jgi:hypothetical protein